MTDAVFGESVPAVVQEVPSRFDAYDTADLWRKDVDHFTGPSLHRFRGVGLRGRSGDG